MKKYKGIPKSFYTHSFYFAQMTEETCAQIEAWESGDIDKYLSPEDSRADFASSKIYEGLNAYAIFEGENLIAMMSSSDEINSLVMVIKVNPAFTGRGYGKHVVDEFLTEAKKHLPGGKFAWAKIDACNMHSIKLLESLGFEDGGRVSKESPFVIREIQLREYKTPVKLAYEKARAPMAIRASANTEHTGTTTKV